MNKFSCLYEYVLNTAMVPYLKQHPTTKILSGTINIFFGFSYNACMGKKSRTVDVEGMVDVLLEKDLLNKIITLQKAVKECLEDLKNEGSNVNHTWKNCVTILGWLVLTRVTDQWARQAALELTRAGKALALIVPVETEVGLDIAVSRLNNVKAGFNLDRESTKVYATGRIATEEWQIENGWEPEQKVLWVKQTLYKQLNRPQGSKVEFPANLDEELNRIFISRRCMGDTEPD